MPISEETRAEIKRLLATPKALLTGLDRQRAYIARMEIVAMPCWSCAEPVSYFDAAPADYKLGEAASGLSRPPECPHCGVEMYQVVPFVIVGHPWHWGNPKIYKPTDPLWQCNNEDCGYKGPKSTFDFGAHGGMPNLGGCRQCGSNNVEPVPPAEDPK